MIGRGEISTFFRRLVEELRVVVASDVVVVPSLQVAWRFVVIEAQCRVKL